MSIQRQARLFSFGRSFIENALAEVERFKKQRTADLKEIFINYAILQIKISKRVSPAGQTCVPMRTPQSGVLIRLVESQA